MDTALRRWHFKEGDEVRSGDDHKLGTVVALYPDATRPTHLVVEGGLLFRHGYFVPVDAVTTHDGERIYVGATREEAQARGWDVEPGAATTIVGTAVGAAAPAAETTRLEAGETIRVPVHEEELTAAPRPREIGQVRIEKRVVAEERTIEASVTEERVRVERRTVDRPADASDAAAFEEGVIAVPIRGEEVELRKQVRVAEEIEIGKEQVERTERVAGTVRREEVRVREVDAAPTGGTGGGRV